MSSCPSLADGVYHNLPVNVPNMFAGNKKTNMWVIDSGTNASVKINSQLLPSCPAYWNTYGFIANPTYWQNVELFGNSTKTVTSATFVIETVSIMNTQYSTWENFCAPLIEPSALPPTYKSKTYAQKVASSSVSNIAWVGMLGCSGANSCQLPYSVPPINPGPVTIKFGFQLTYIGGLFPPSFHITGTDQDGVSLVDAWVIFSPRELSQTSTVVPGVDGSPCIPEAADADACGTDFCGRQRFASLCTELSTSNTCVAGQCVCAPKCSPNSNACGADGCGGSCGTCASGSTCVAGTCSSVSCPNSSDVLYNGQCCSPTCAVNSCGDNGCGGSCGACANGSSCVNGTCSSSSGSCPNATDVLYNGKCCSPTCSDAAGHLVNFCGDDGCGGSCGSCGVGQTCCDGQCTSLNPGEICCPHNCPNCTVGTACNPSCEGKECGYNSCCTSVCGGMSSCPDPKNPLCSSKGKCVGGIPCSTTCVDGYTCTYGFCDCGGFACPNVTDVCVNDTCCSPTACEKNTCNFNGCTQCSCLPGYTCLGGNCVNVELNIAVGCVILVTVLTVLISILFIPQVYAKIK